ncbi:hypothetical protein [Streptomyces sp. Ru73]|uniref:hypothetical protein n=1 Tax=Streptomyces sp. Ru73 TaxID=2080748 RepID=UPI00215611D4|nr:hypothetical protein [Streptomyces sp. Ru73]
MTDFLRGLRARLTGGGSGPGRPRAQRPPARKGPHNLFEAAATHVAACAEGDEDRGAEAADWVSPEALAFGINELACRALIALARERRQSPQEVARDLLSLPAA